MNIDVTVHPTLHHHGLLTAKLDPMIDWYRKMLGMEVHHRSARPANAGAPFSAMAFLGNNEADRRIVFFEMPEVPTNAERRVRGPFQHVAFQCETFDDFLGTHSRLKNTVGG
jgi:catechol 2,3-dioxygenase